MKKKKTNNFEKVNQWITVFLVVAFVGCIGAFAGLSAYAKYSQEQKAAALQAAIDNCIAVCKENAEKVEVDVDLLGNIAVYEENINAQESLLQKAYIALTMTTYVTDVINLNDPVTNYELALELGSPNRAEGQILSYEEYSYAITEAQEEMLLAQDDYLTVPKNNPDEPGLIEYQ